MNLSLQVAHAYARVCVQIACSTTWPTICSSKGPEFMNDGFYGDVSFPFQVGDPTEDTKTPKDCDLTGTAFAYVASMDQVCQEARRTID